MTFDFPRPLAIDDMEGVGEGQGLTLGDLGVREDFFEESLGSNVEVEALGLGGITLGVLGRMTSAVLGAGVFGGGVCVVLGGVTSGSL